MKNKDEIGGKKYIIYTYITFLYKVDIISFNTLCGLWHSSTSSGTNPPGTCLKCLLCCATAGCPGDTECLWSTRANRYSGFKA